MNTRQMLFSLFVGFAAVSFAMVLGILVFGERPDAMTLGGAALIIASGLYTFLRERRLVRQEARRRQAGAAEGATAG